MKAKEPRTAYFWGARSEPHFGRLETWLEPEELCYPSGGKHRRAKCIDITTGKSRIVHCGIPDTYFSIPCKEKGYVYMEEGIFTFRPYTTEQGRI